MVRPTEKFDLDYELAAHGIQLPKMGDDVLGYKHAEDTVEDFLNRMQASSFDPEVFTSYHSGGRKTGRADFFAQAKRMFGHLPDGEAKREAWVLTTAVIRYIQQQAKTVDRIFEEKAQPLRDELQVIRSELKWNWELYQSNPRIQEIEATISALPQQLKEEYFDLSTVKIPDSHFHEIRRERKAKIAIRRTIIARAEEFQEYRIDLDWRQIFKAGITNEQDCNRFLDIWKEVAVPGDPFSSYRNPPAARVHHMARVAPAAPTWVLAQAIRAGQDPNRISGYDRLFDAAKAWKLCPVMWTNTAVRVGRMPLWNRMVAAALVGEMAEEQRVSLSYIKGVPCIAFPFSGDSVPKWNRNRDLQYQFWGRFQQAVQKGRTRALVEHVADNPANRKRVIGIFHERSGLDDKEKEALANHAPISSLIGFKIGAWKKAFSQLVETHWEAGNIPEWVAPGSVGLVHVFGRGWQNWLKQQPPGRSDHDAVYWLPASGSAEELAGLDKWLFKFKDRNTAELEMVAKNWSELTGDQKKLSYRELLSVCRSRYYENQKDEAFGVEAAHWGVSEDQYPEFEALYLDSQRIPEPFDTKARFESGGLVGRFLPRSDVRSGFFGQHTDCCQHLKGAGASAARSSMTDAFSQVFVVEKEGKIVAGSWVWQAENPLPDKEGNNQEFLTACCDSIEKLILTDEQLKAVETIYQHMGEALAQEGHRRVTIGEGGFAGHKPASLRKVEPLPMPRGYKGYSDARHAQVLLMDNPDALPAKELPDKVWLKTGSEEELRVVQKAAASYPEAFAPDAIPDGENARNLMLISRRHGVIGYAAWDEERRHINDLVVMPVDGKRDMTASLKLATTLFDRCRALGGEWSVEIRGSAGYRLLQALEKRGEITLHEDGQAHEIKEDGSVCNVRFSVEKRIGKSDDAPRGRDDARVVDHALRRDRPYRVSL